MSVNTTVNTSNTTIVFDPNYYLKEPDKGVHKESPKPSLDSTNEQIGDYFPVSKSK